MEEVSQFIGNDNIILNNLLKNNITLFKNPFVEHLFFDTYIRSGSGNNSYKVIETFILFLKSFNVNNNIINGVLLPILENSYSFSNIDYNINISFTKYKDSILRLIDENGSFLYLGGWLIKDPHAVCLYYEKSHLNENKYNISIINSGMGVNHHGEERTDGKVPIIIKYDNVSREKLIEVLKLERRCKLDPNLYSKYISSLTNIFINFPDIELDPYNIESNNIKLNEILRSRRLISEDQKKIKLFLNDKIRNIYLESDFYYKKGLPNIDDYFYDNIESILGKTNNKIYYDYAQLSASCSFYSIYYFIKNFITSKPTLQSQEIFKRFDIYIRHTIIDLIISTEKSLLKNIDYKDYNDYLSFLYILNKDYNYKNDKITELIKMLTQNVNRLPFIKKNDTKKS